MRPAAPEQEAAFLRRGIEGARSKRDVGAHCVRGCMDGIGRGRCLPVVMDPNGFEVITETLFHEGARVSIERLSR